MCEGPSFVVQLREEDLRDPDKLKEIILNLHGDLCPASVYGVRAGLRALRELGLRRGSKDLVAVVESVSCLADGVEIATGCTVGSGTLFVMDYGKCSAIFIDKRTKRAIKIRLEEDLDRFLQEDYVKVVSEFWSKRKELSDNERQEYKRRIKEMQEKALEKLLREPDEKLLVVEEVELKYIPELTVEQKYGLNIVKCDECGEYVEASRTRFVNGRRLCIPCAGESFYLPKRA